jgi:cytochrome c553
MNAYPERPVPPKGSSLITQPLRLYRALLTAIIAALAVTASGSDNPHLDAALEWAYPRGAPAPLPSAPSGIQHLPGSSRTFTQAEMNDHKSPPDWSPAEHPPAPPIVGHARAGVDEPCAECHLFNGVGFLGAPDLAGLPATYIVSQVLEFRSGRRHSWQRNRPGTQEMINATRSVTRAELASAAAYYAGLPRRSRYRVVETNTVPLTRPNYYGWLDLVSSGGLEPIRGRIIEVPEDTARMFLADPHVGVVIYVPIGATNRGEVLVSTGGSSGLPCAGCHGLGLRGMGDTPPIVGRSAAYIARMLWDIKTGARSGPAVARMQSTVAALTETDITDIAAYLAAQKP